MPVPGGSAKARVVMLGVTYEHLDIGAQFLAWVEKERILEPSSVVIEWLDTNPFAHNDPKYAPVGNYMFSPIDEDVVREANPSLHPTAYRGLRLLPSAGELQR